MASQGENGWSRREFLRGPTLARAAVILGLKSESAAAEPPPETTRIRIHDSPITCFAPVYVAEELLKAEGFTDVQYIKTPLIKGGSSKALADPSDKHPRNGVCSGGSAGSNDHPPC
jgi:hypothetical protein